jgi:hypothetical protein
MEEEVSEDQEMKESKKPMSSAKQFPLDIILPTGLYVTYLWSLGIFPTWQIF